LVDLEAERNDALTMVRAEGDDEVADSFVTVRPVLSRGRPGAHPYFGLWSPRRC
jgi:hypothetical protein